MTKKMPTLFGITILLIGVAAGVLLIKNKQIFRLGATEDIEPKDIRISNVSDSTFTVSWTTGKKTTGLIKWGDTTTFLNKNAKVNEKSPIYTHSIKVDNLSENKTYYFLINSDGINYDNNSIPFEVRTGPKLPNPAPAIVISGIIITETKIGVSDALVYVTVGGSNLLSTTTLNGNWSLSLSLARTKDLSSYIEIDEKKSLIEISVQGGPDGMASAVIYPAAARLVPPIILGQHHDFRNLTPISFKEVPKAQVFLLDNQTSELRYDVLGASSPSSLPSTISLSTVPSLSQGPSINSPSFKDSFNFLTFLFSVALGHMGLSPLLSLIQ